MDVIVVLNTVCAAQPCLVDMCTVPIAISSKADTIGSVGSPANIHGIDPAPIHPYFEPETSAASSVLVHDNVIPDTRRVGQPLGEYHPTGSPNGANRKPDRT
jgi:hypothetical protein